MFHFVHFVDTFYSIDESPTFFRFAAINIQIATEVNIVEYIVQLITINMDTDSSRQVIWKCRSTNNITQTVARNSHLYVAVAPFDWDETKIVDMTLH